MSISLPPRRFFLPLGLLCLALAWSTLARAVDAPPPPVAPETAQHLLDVLRDDGRRAELERTLDALVKTTEPAAAPLPEPEPAPATEPEPAPAAPIALQKDGVVAQVFGLLARGLDNAGRQVRATTDTLLSLPALGRWWQQHMATPEARVHYATAALIMTALLLLALGAEWLARRALGRPRGAVSRRAEALYAKEDDKWADHPAHADTVAAHAPADALGSAGPGDTPAPPPPDHHLGVLRRTPAVLAHALLDLLPLAAFLAVTALGIALLGGENASFFPAIVPIAAAYAGTRLAMGIARIFVSPEGPWLRLIHMRDSSARYLHTWTRRIVATALFGAEFAELAVHLGASDDAHNALSKLIALVVHAMLIVVAIQSRKRVAAWIRGEGRGTPHAHGSLRALAADGWLAVALALIAASWAIWTLGMDNGFSQMLRYAGLTLAVILAATALSIVLMGVLERVLLPRPDREGDAGAPPPETPYYLLLAQRGVSLLVGVAAVVALLEVWGVHALAWFQPGTVGRRLLSAAGTTAVACALAIVAWEGANMAIDRRIRRWTDQGDQVRARRLRTLVPILRSTLFAVIAMVVLLTALNQLGINIAPLLAGASIFGVALGFGSQKLVQDFITGIFLLTENAMQVGDSVTLAGLSGTVEYLSVRTVRLRAGDGALHVIPFSSVGTVTNTTRGYGNAAIRVSVPIDADLGLVREAIKEAGKRVREAPETRHQVLGDLDLYGVDQLDGSSMTLAAQIRTRDSARAGVLRAFNQFLLEAFRARGLRFAHPRDTTAAPAPKDTP